MIADVPVPMFPKDAAAVHQEHAGQQPRIPDGKPASVALGPRFPQTAPNRRAKDLSNAGTAHSERLEQRGLRIRDRPGRGPESREELVPVSHRRRVDQQDRREIRMVGQGLLEFLDGFLAERSAQVAQEHQQTGPVTEQPPQVGNGQILAAHRRIQDKVWDIGGIHSF